MKPPTHALGVGLAAVLCGIFASTSSAQNTVITYQGRIQAQGTNFSGLGRFKFALVTSTNANHVAQATAVVSGGSVIGANILTGGNGYGSAPVVTLLGGGGSGAVASSVVGNGAVTSISIVNGGSGYTNAPTMLIDPPPPNYSYTTLWSNDGTSVAGGEPAAPVYINVNQGVFMAALGDTAQPNMAALDTSVFAQPNVQVRLWFDDGVSGSAALDPPQNLTAVPRALYAPSSVVTNSQYLPGTPTGNGQALTNLAGHNLQPGTINSNAFDAATVQALLSWTSNAYPVLNPKAFGGYCDGVHNDSAALSNALYAASLNRGTVFIPKPGILCQDPIWMGGAVWGNAFPLANPKLMGSDANTYIVFRPNSGTTGAFLTLSNVSLDIENLHIIGPGRNVGNWDGIVYTNTGGGFIFRNLTFRGWSGHPFFNEIRARVTADSLYFFDNAEGMVNAGYVEGCDLKSAVWGADIGMDNNWVSSLGNSRTMANRIRLNTQYCTNGLVLGSGASAVDFYTFSENYYESLLDIGHKPGRMADAAPPGLVWFHDSYGQGGQAPPQMVRLWTNAAALTVSRVVNEAIVGARTNSLICSSNSVADNTPFAIENCADANANLLRLSNGQVITGTAADRDYINMPFRFFNSGKGGTNQLLALNDGANALTLSNNVPVNSDGANVVSQGFVATQNGYSAGGQQGISAVLTLYGSTNVLRLTVAGGIIVGASYAPLGSAAPAQTPGGVQVPSAPRALK